MAGIPTVLITTDKESSQQQRPPRAINPEGFTWGHSLGTAGNKDLQMAVLRTALRQFEELHMPGTVRTLAFEGYKP
ncbi:MAG: hypothetical protein JWN15_996 [Firmicutes bacterium]|nr:hypothetical protein [Bacillota bacterium]